MDQSKVQHRKVKYNKRRYMTDHEETKTKKFTVGFNVKLFTE